MGIFLGSDPEIFVHKSTGSLFPAFEFMGSKISPNKTKDGNNAYWDGFQAEYNITAQPYIAGCLNSLRSGLSAVIDQARKHDPGAYLSSKPVVKVDLNYLKTLPEEFTEFGCMPSYNAYKIRGNTRDGRHVPHRFAGGHIHFGIGLTHSRDTVEEIVKALDSILAVACVSLFENIDDPVRRQYYGLPGEFRVPEHGLEYRPLSNAWLFHPQLAAIILDLARKVLFLGMSGKRSLWKVESEAFVTETIILSDVEKARNILKKNIEILEDLNGSINFLEPVENSFETIHNIEANWGI